MGTSIAHLVILLGSFGSDFLQLWSDEDLGLKHVKGDGTLGFLITHTPYRQGS